MTGQRQLETIAEHTVLHPLRGPVLDVGARSFAFSREMANRDFFVVAMEPDPTVEDPKDARIRFLQAALYHGNDGRMRFSMDADPQARHLVDDGGDVTVDTMNITSVMHKTGVERWGIVKLDCEGAEYQILLEWPGHIADQISVEFHDHVEQRPVELYNAILDHLGIWYRIVQHGKSVRHCIATPNYWDSLFVLRGP